MKIAILDYGSGNLRSAQKAFERAALEEDLSANVELVSDPDGVKDADKIVLPGVGAYADCKAGLSAVPGLIEALEEAVQTQGKPFMGICVGMQLMATAGHEKAITQGLGWIEGDVVAIEPQDKTLKIPQIGWNSLSANGSHPLLEGIELGEEGLHAYFVHSYQMQCKDNADVLAVTAYGGDVTAMIARDNMVGTQFHPEKSQKLGLKLISNFLRWEP